MFKFLFEIFIYLFIHNVNKFLSKSFVKYTNNSQYIYLEFNSLIDIIREKGNSGQKEEGGHIF